MSNSTCCVEDCNKPRKGRFCSMHTERLRVHGSLDKPKPKPKHYYPCIEPGCVEDAHVKGRCPAHYKAAHYQTNRERYLASQKADRVAHPDKYHAYAQAYYLRNPQKWVESQKKRDRAAISEYQRHYRTVNAELVRERKALAYLADKAHVNERSRLYYQQNRDRMRQKMREWAASHPDRVRELASDSKGRRRARKLGRSVSKADLRLVLREFGMVCHICGGDIASKSDLHFDHVIPLALGGAHATDNIRPSHAFCNLRKGARIQ